MEFKSRIKAADFVVFPRFPDKLLEHVSDKGERASPAPGLTLDDIDSLKGEIAFLRGQLDQRSRELADERERSDVLHREAFARIKALTAGLVEIEREILRGTSI